MVEQFEYLIRKNRYKASNTAQKLPKKAYFEP